LAAAVMVARVVRAATMFTGSTFRFSRMTTTSLQVMIETPHNLLITGKGSLEIDVQGVVPSVHPSIRS